MPWPGTSCAAQGSNRYLHCLMPSTMSKYFTSSVTHFTHQCHCVFAFCLTRASMACMSKRSVKSVDIIEKNEPVNDCVSSRWYPD